MYVRQGIKPQSHDIFGHQQPNQPQQQNPLVRDLYQQYDGKTFIERRRQAEKEQARQQQERNMQELQRQLLHQSPVKNDNFRNPNQRSPRTYNIISGNNNYAKPVKQNTKENQMVQNPMNPQQQYQQPMKKPMNQNKGQFQLSDGHDTQYLTYKERKALQLKQESRLAIQRYEQSILQRQQMQVNRNSNVSTINLGGGYQQVSQPQKKQRRVEQPKKQLSYMEKPQQNSLVQRYKQRQQPNQQYQGLDFRREKPQQMHQQQQQKEQPKYTLSPEEEADIRAQVQAEYYKDQAQPQAQPQYQLTPEEEARLRAEVEAELQKDKSLQYKPKQLESNQQNYY